jgi:hypothetical protein
MNGTEIKAAAAGGISAGSSVVMFANEWANVWVMLGVGLSFLSLVFGVVVHVRNHKLKTRELDMLENDRD